MAARGETGWQDRRTISPRFLRYVAFALLAMVANLAVQELVVRGWPAAPLLAAIAAGTGAGFAIKYLLDKLWVFDDAFTGYRQEASKIALYGLFSIATTLIFWATELAFWMIWQTAPAKYAGAVLGLALGYVIKFCLDRRFVFRAARS